MKKKQLKRVARKAPPKKVSTALARRPARTMLSIGDPHGLVPAHQALVPLANVPTLNIGFVGTFKLKPEQIAALRQKITDDEIEFKPTRKDGPDDLPYISHNVVRDRFDAAFGIGGWGMAPKTMPVEKDGVVIQQYALVVDGVERVFAWGEQAYHANNKQMTYGDAIEGAKSNAIVRCGKELGVARELWGKRNIAAIKARLLKGNKAQQRRSEEPERDPVAGTRHAHQDAPISDTQYARMLHLIKSAGRTRSEVLAYLAAFYGITVWDNVRTGITRSNYDAICAAIERRGALPDKDTQVREADEILDADDISFDFPGGER